MIRVTQKSIIFKEKKQLNNINFKESPGPL